MTQTQTYTLDSFIADVRNAFASTPDPVARAEAVRGHLRQLLAVPGWLEERLQLPAEGGFGRHDLHVDAEYGHPAPGFLVMCSVQRPGQSGTPPHDHGASWVVYGVYKGAIEQRKYRWAYPEAPTKSAPKLEESERYVQGEGEVAYFLPGEIHSTGNVSAGRSLVVRVEAQKLDGVWRHRYDKAANTARAFQAGA
ncbi:MAG: hypothetical protein ACREOH_03965 [Candidatus Entotheonellia bacterium]